jgi:hypothetical protein
MQAIEKMLGDAFKNLPTLPEEARKGLATALPWLALVGGVLSLVGAWYLYDAVSNLNQLYSAFGYTGPVAGISGVAWVTVVVLVAQAVLFLLAFPALRTGKKSGWNFALMAMLVTVVYSVIYNLFSGYLNFGGFVFSLIGSAFGLYLLFQVRSHFGGTETAAKPAAPAAPKTDKKV